MPSLPPNPILPASDGDAISWIRRWNDMFGRIWFNLIYVVNALCKVDTAANRTTTPLLNETLFIASDTYQGFAAISGTWKHIGRVGGTSHGAIEFTEISDADAPSANGGRLYVRDNGAGKSQLVIRFNSGAVQVIATEP